MGVKEEEKLIVEPFVNETSPEEVEKEDVEKITVQPPVEKEEQEEESSSEDEDEEDKERPKKGKISDHFLEKQKKKTGGDKKTIIKPADLGKNKSKFEALRNKANIKVELPSEQPIRRKRKEPVVEEPAPLIFDETPQEAVLEKEEEGEVVPNKDKVSDHFPDKEEKVKEEEKLVIEPLVNEKEDLDKITVQPPVEKETEEEESSSEDEDEEDIERPKKGKISDHF